MQWFGWYWFFYWFPIIPVYFFKTAWTVRSTLTTIRNTINRNIKMFLSSLGRSRYLLIFKLIIFALWSARTVLLFMLFNTRSDRLAAIRWPVFISKYHREYCILLDRFWFEFTGFSSIIKYESHVKFQAKYLPPPAALSLALLLC